MHGLVAWLAGYKSSPFAIHYGSDWFTLWDIDADVPYSQIIADGKLKTMAAIAIAPLLLQSGLFLIGLRALSLFSFNRWVFAFIYWFVILQISEIYSYIPIRSFTSHGDIYHFLYAAEGSPWIVAVPGTLFVLWGIYHMLYREVPRAYSILKINTQLGRWTFLFANILLFFGYYGAVGFARPYPIDHYLSLVSWILIPFVFIYFYLNKK